MVAPVAVVGLRSRRSIVVPAILTALLLARSVPAAAATTPPSRPPRRDSGPPAGDPSARRSAAGERGGARVKHLSRRDAGTGLEGRPPPRLHRPGPGGRRGGGGADQPGEPVGRNRPRRASSGSGLSAGGRGGDRAAKVKAWRSLGAIAAQQRGERLPPPQSALIKTQRSLARRRHAGRTRRSARPPDRPSRGYSPAHGRSRRGRPFRILSAGRTFALRVGNPHPR